MLKFDDHELRKLFYEEIFGGRPRDKNPTRYLYIMTRVEKYGMLWSITAVVDGSIGYYAFNTAKDLIESVLIGRRFCSDRTFVCRRGDPAYELAFDLYCMEEMTVRNPEKVKYLMDFVQRLSFSPISANTVDLLYPTR